MLNFVITGQRSNGHRVVAADDGHAVRPDRLRACLDDEQAYEKDHHRGGKETNGKVPGIHQRSIPAPEVRLEVAELPVNELPALYVGWKESVQPMLPHVQNV